MKHLLVLLLLLCSASVSAQDVIVKKDGSTVVCRIVEVTATEITYKKWSELNGSNYVMDKSLVSAINYQSGKRDTFSETESLYKPNNQNNGEQAMNDKALLRLDAAINNPYKKVKTLKTIGWVGGGVLLVAGGLFLSSGDSIFAIEEDWLMDADASVVLGVIGTSAAVVWASSFLIAAHSVKKKIDSQMLYYSIYQYDMPFSNGSSLSVGTDLISNRVLGTNTLGLGLRYNF